MCFNETASLTAFSIGSVFLGFMLNEEIYLYSILYFTIIIMQMAEFFAHKSIKNKDTDLNKISAIFIFLILFIQPLAYNYYKYNYVYETNNHNIVFIISIIFIIFSCYYFFYLLTNEMFEITPLHKCYNNFCRLNWSYFSKNTLLGSIFMFLYFAIFSTDWIFKFNYNTIPNILFMPFIYLLILSILYMIFADKIKKYKYFLSGFGSIWCISTVIFGPAVLYYHYYIDKLNI